MHHFISEFINILYKSCFNYWDGHICDKLEKVNELSSKNESSTNHMRTAISHSLFCSTTVLWLKIYVQLYQSCKVISGFFYTGSIHEIQFVVINSVSIILSYWYILIISLCKISIEQELKKGILVGLLIHFSNVVPVHHFQVLCLKVKHKILEVLAVCRKKIALSPIIRLVNWYWNSFAYHQLVHFQWDVSNAKKLMILWN